MKANLIERRQKMVKLRASGLSLTKVIKDLAAECEVTTRALYYDWKHRKTWLKTILELKDPETFFLDLLSKHKEISRLAMLEYLQADNSNAKIGALRLLKEINKDFFEMVTVQEMLVRVEKLESKAGVE